MGRKISRSLDDMIRHGHSLLLVCGCGRKDVYDALQLHIWNSAHRRSEGLEATVARLRCRCGAPLKDWGFSGEFPNVDLGVVALERSQQHDRRAALYRGIVDLFTRRGITRASAKDDSQGAPSDRPAS